MITWQPPETVYEISLLKALESVNIFCEHNQKLGYYYPDLRVVGAKLLIEVDGEYHNAKDIRRRDKKRTKYLETLGYQVIRVTNKQVTNDLSGVLKRIKNAIVVVKNGGNINVEAKATKLAKKSAKSKNLKSQTRRTKPKKETVLASGTVFIKLNKTNHSL